jgi:nitrogen fixation protein FixH
MSLTVSSRSTPHRIDRWIPWLFVAGMAIVVAANGIMVYFAVSSWAGVTVAQPYQRGLAYNRVIEAAAREQALGWTAEASVQRDGAEIWVELRDATARPLSDVAIDAVLLRPLASAAPIPVTLRAQGQGRYAGAVEPLQRGQWELRLAVTRGADAVHVTRRVIVP